MLLMRQLLIERPPPASRVRLILRAQPRSRRPIENADQMPPDRQRHCWPSPIEMVEHVRALDESDSVGRKLAQLRQEVVTNAQLCGIARASIPLAGLKLSLLERPLDQSIRVGLADDILAVDEIALAERTIGE